VLEDAEDINLLELQGEQVEYQEKRADGKRAKCMKLVKDFFRQIWEEKSILVAMFTAIGQSMTMISSMQFGTIIFNEEYAKDDASKDYISDRLSIYLLSG